MPAGHSLVASAIAEATRDHQATNRTSLLSSGGNLNRRRALALPEPTRGGTIDELRPFLNVSNDQEFVLTVAWLLSALRAEGPYPVLALSGEQGSAKSSFARALRTLVDPNTAPLRALPRGEHDVYISASNGHILSFDNISGLSASTSDMLCRLATGAGFAVRMLYSNDEEMLFNVARPVILNGIEDIATRSDLADRSVILSLPPIPDQLRRPELQFLRELKSAQPRILGALLDAMVVGLGRQSVVSPPALPRMADFVLWGIACETAYRPPGAFLDAYRHNQGEAIEIALEADEVAVAITELIGREGSWTGTAATLLSKINSASPSLVHTKDWPANSRAIGGRLRRLAPFFRKSGIEIEFGKQGRSRSRTIVITRPPEIAAQFASAPSASSVSQ